MTTRVLYPGSFDPIHNGHVEIVETAARLFDEVVVAAVGNPEKQTGMFTLDERAEMITEVFSDLPHVRAVTHTDLVVRLAQSLNVDFILKGLRAVNDFESELQQAQLNKQMSGIETMFLPSASSSSFLASRYVREIARLGGDVAAMVPGPVLLRLSARLSPSD